MPLVSTPTLPDGFNTNLPAGDAAPQAIRVAAGRLIDVVFEYARRVGAKVEALAAPAQFLWTNPPPADDYGGALLTHSCRAECEVRRGGQRIVPTSFDFEVLEDDEVRIDVALC